MIILKIQITVHHNFNIIVSIRIMIAVILKIIMKLNRFRITTCAKFGRVGHYVFTEPTTHRNGKEKNDHICRKAQDEKTSVDRTDVEGHYTSQLSERSLF